MRFSDEIRKAVEESGVTRYRVWRDTGIDQGFMCKFVHGECGLSMETLDVLADYLDLHVATGKPGVPSKRKRQQRKGR